MSAVERFSTHPLNLEISVKESKAFSANGSIFLLGGNRTNANLRTLTAIDVGGVLQWQTQISTAGNNEAFRGASNNQACFSGDSSTLSNDMHRIRCFDARSGRTQIDITRNRVNPYGGISLKVLNDQVLLVEGETAEGTDMYYSGVASNGEEIFRRRLPDYSYRWALHNNGLISLSGGTRFGPTGQSIRTDSLMSAWDLNGQLLWQKNYLIAITSPEAINVFQNGVLLTLGEQTTDGSLVPAFEYLDFAGQQIWQKRVEGGGYTQRISRFPGFADASIAEEFRQGSASFYSLRAYYGTDAFPGLRSELQKFDLRNGNEIWHTNLAVDPRPNTKALLLPTSPINQKTGLVIIGKSKFGEQHVELLDAASGGSLGTQPTPKNTDFFPITDDVTGVFRTDGLNSWSFSLERLNWTASSLVPVLNPSHVGAWHNPATPGQGFFLEQIGNTQFLAWFHNDWGVFDANVSDFLSPARQRWLTLQGDVVPGANSAALKIYDTGGGTFTSVSAGAPKQVGSATLSFQGCNSATLSYEVNSQRCIASLCAPESQFAILHGSIFLQPLVPATSCATATSLPAPVSAKTGLFHDPNVSGQGLLSVAGANTYFAGWFAADPSDAADDPQKQVWFTLQADLAANSGNIVNAKIYRTLGGRRDTPVPAMSQEEIGRAHV